MTISKKFFLTLIAALWFYSPVYADLPTGNKGEDGVEEELVGPTMRDANLGEDEEAPEPGEEPVKKKEIPHKKDKKKSAIEEKKDTIKEDAKDEEPEEGEAKTDKKGTHTKEEDKEKDGEKKGKKINEYVEFGGAIEVEPRWGRDFDRRTHSDIVLEAAELDFEITTTEWATGLLSIEWEPDCGWIQIKEAYVTFGGTECYPYYFRAGRLFVPFGLGTGAVVGDTLTISDPLTIEIFETREDVLMVGHSWNGWQTAAYVFNEDQPFRDEDNHCGHRRDHFKHDCIDQFGASIRYGSDNPGFAYHVGLDFISSVFSSDGLSEVFPRALKRKWAPGIAFHARYFRDGLSLIGEYDTALRRTSFPKHGEKLHLMPSAMMLEVGYITEIYCRKTFFAIDYSQTEDMEGEFPKRRILASMGQWLTDDILIGIEYGHDWDYSTSHGGTGRQGDHILGQIAYEW